MQKSQFIVRLSAVAVMLVYVLSTIGVNVHSCHNSGSFIVSIAGNEVCDHCCDCWEHHCECEAHGGEESSLDCCSDTLLRIVIAGCDGSDNDVKVPLSAVVPSFSIPSSTLESFSAPAANYAQCNSISLPGKDVLRENCVLRV